MNHNNPLPPLWQVATTTGGHQPRMNSSAGSSTSKLTAGSISSVKYVSNARPTMKIINIPNQQQASMTATATSDGTLLYGTSFGGAGSYLTVTNDQRQMQPPPQVRRPVTTTTTTTTHAALLNESILLQTPDGREYLVDERSIQNIDQIPPENLIYMTASEALSVGDADDVGQLAIVDESQLALHDYVVQAEATIDQTQQQLQEPATSAEAQQYAEECEVTEEVITDDWVQPQGEECVQVTVDQLGVSAVVVQEEDDISVPLDQDQYTLSRPYPCDFCSRRFRKKSSLQNHLMAHSNDRPHCCNLCGAQYSHRADLINHLKQHAYSVAEQDELALRSDQEAEYDLPDLGHTSSGGGGHSMKHRLRHSSDDEDMYIQNSMVSYNSQPPMQLISTTHYGASTSSTIGSSSYAHEVPMEQPSYLESVPPVLEQKYALGKMDPAGPATLSTTGKRTPRKKQSQSTQDTRTARTKPVFVSKVGSRQIKKEPLDHGEGGNAISSPPPTRTVAADWRKPFVCQQCGASFAREKALLSHARTHAGSTRYDCALCNAHFWEQSLLRDHVQRAHPSQEAWVADHEPYGGEHGAIELPVVTTPTTKQYNCDSCSAAFFQLDHLLNHTHHAHGTFEQHQQPSSNRSVLVKQELLQTSSKVELESDREAEATDQEAVEENEEEEGEEYDNLEYTIEHYEQQAPPPPPPQRSNEPDQSALTCRDCGESFDSAMDLLDHSEVHGGGAAQYEPLECQLCGEKFPDEANIKQHVQDRHRDELTATSCAICGKRCKSQTTLMKHAWDHSRERAHSCSKCGKTFHHMTRLKRHMDSHRNKAVRCEVCKEEFPDGRTLMNHRHSHTKSNEYPCHECGKTFGSRSSQQIHMRIHTGERPYACRFCWKAFADGGTLRKHERIHTGEKPYACPVCPKAFNQRVVLREHIRAHHSQADAKRGSPDQPYYCTVCSSPFGTTADLVQHLIEHSDTNTAMKRKPPTFPRKYKRRRKLKPHELERLQSGRRKQKSKRQMDNEEEEEEEEEDDDDGSGGSGNQFEDGTTAHSTDRTVERAGGDVKPTGSSFVRYHPDGTRKASTREMYLEYDDMGGGSATHAPKASSQGMLDVNGINLLSNVVLLHGQQEEPSNAHNNNHLPESPPQHAFGELPKAKQHQQQQPPGSSRMIYTQKSTTKAAPASSRKTPSTRKRPAAKEQRPAAAPPPPVKLEPDEDDPAIAMEALFRGRKRNASLLPEIPPHRISSVGFPLLDDGNTDDPMDEPEQRARRSTASFSASEDDLLSQQLLMEISHKSKYTERFNSDTLNDLEEILRSPVKGAGSPAVTKRATTVASTSATSKKQQQSAAAAKKPTSQRKRTAAPKAKAAAKANNKPAASSTASGAGSSSSRQPPKPVEKRAAREPPAVLRSQRLTRRQLEREVNFLKEAYDAGEPVHETTADGSGGSSSVAVVKTEAVDKRFLLDGTATGVAEALDRPDSSERLAAMLLNDGLPDESDSSSSSGEGSRRSSVMSTAARQTHKYGPESYAEGLQMMETAEDEHVVKQEDDQGQGEHHYELGDDDVGELYLDDNDTTTSATTPATAIGDEPLHRCSICCACFDDRAQLILHVPVHI